MNAKKYFKFIPYAIIVALLIALSVTQCSKQKLKDQVTAPPDSTNYFNGKLASIQADGEALKQKWVKDSLEIKASEIKYKRVASKATKERDQARAKIQYLYDSIPEVKEFVQLDSVSDKINLDRIGELEFDQAKIISEFNERLSNKDDQIKLCGELTDHYVDVNQYLKKQVKKERRRKTIWKIAAGAFAAGLLYQSVNK